LAVIGIEDVIPIDERIIAVQHPVEIVLAVILPQSKIHPENIRPHGTHLAKSLMGGIGDGFQRRRDRIIGRRIVWRGHAAPLSGLLVHVRDAIRADRPHIVRFGSGQRHDRDQPSIDNRLPGRVYHEPSIGRSIGCRVAL